MNNIIKYTKLKKKLKIEISKSIESKEWDKAKNLCKRLDRLKNAMM